MRIIFKTASIPTRAAKRLETLMGLKNARAKAWTAYILGYRDWHELHSELGQSAGTPLDEACSALELKERRNYQVTRLGDCCTAVKQPFTVEGLREIVQNWQPSSAHPQVTAKAEVPSREGKSRLMALLTIFYERQLTEAGWHAFSTEFLDKLRYANSAEEYGWVTGVGQELISSAQVKHKVFARAIFEAMSARNCALATYNLAISLSMGDGGPADQKRAADLVARVMEMSDASEELIRYAKMAMASFLVQGGGRAPNRKKAMELWEQAALEGESVPAFNVGLNCDPNAPHTKPENVNPEKSAKFYRISAEQGHVPAMSNLGLLLQTQPRLQIEMMEGHKWLSLAAEDGDEQAINCLKEINKAADKLLRKLDRNEIPAHQLSAVFDAMAKMAKK